MQLHLMRFVCYCSYREFNRVRFFYIQWNQNLTRSVFSLVAGCSRKTRIIDVVYNASNNEMVRTKTLVKNCIVQIDSTPFRQWYEAHYTVPLARKKGAKLVRNVLVIISSLSDMKKSYSSTSSSVGVVSKHAPPVARAPSPSGLCNIKPCLVSHPLIHYVRKYLHTDT